MKAVDKIIFNELSSRRPVILPTVGTLNVERLGARVEGGKMLPPVNKVVFSESDLPGAMSLVALIESYGTDASKAETVYYEWLASSRSESVLNIEGVGELKGLADDMGEQKSWVFYPSRELEEALNPSAAVHAGVVAPQGGRKRKSCAFLWIMIVLILLLLGGIAYYMYREGMLECFKNKVVPVAPVSQQSSTVVKETVPAVENVEQVVADDTPVAVHKKFYVVAGVFENPDNADKLAGWYTDNYPDVRCEKIPYYNGMTLVSIYSSDDRNDAWRQLNRYIWSMANYELWVYSRE